MTDQSGKDRERVPTIDIRDGYHGVRVGEANALSASPIACAVADDWTTWRTTNPEKYAASVHSHRKHLDALEFATRYSPLRKVKP